MSKNINKFRLKNTEKTDITDLSLTSGAAVYSDAIDIRRNEGFMTLLVKEDKSGGAGDVDISAEYSLDNSTWHAAYSTSGGTITVDDNIVTALQNATRWIVFTARAGHFIRFKFDPDADSQVTADFIFQEED